MSGDRHPWSPGQGDVREAEGMARMILGREPAGGSCWVTQEGEALWGWSGEDLGLEKGAAAQETSPRLSRNLGEREPAGWVRGAGEGWLGGLGWLTSSSNFFFFSLYFAVFWHLVLLMIALVTICFWIFGHTAWRVDLSPPTRDGAPR